MANKHMKRCSISLIIQFSSVARSCPTLCDPMNHSTPGLPVHHQPPEFTQTHVHRVNDAIQPSHPLSPPSPPVPSHSLLEKCKSKLQWDTTSHQSEWPSSHHQMSTTINAGEGVEKREHSCIAGGNVNWYSHYGETVWRFLKKLGIKLLFDPTISLLGIYSEETKIEKDTCTSGFNAALFTIDRTRNQPRCSLTDEWMKTFWYVYTMELLPSHKKECIWLSLNEVDEPRAYYRVK